MYSSKSTELDLLKKSFERLNVQYRQAEDKLNEFREKLRDARIELSGKDRQLDVAKRLLQKLTEEKTELQAVAEQGKAINRKLGAKLAVNPELADTQAKLLRYRGKAAEAQVALHEVETRLMLSEETNRHQSAELAVLKRALGLRTDLPDVFTDYAGQAQLLKALAQSQEEASSLAAQLADSQRQANSLEAQAHHLHGEVDRLVSVKLELEGGLTAARREAAEAAAAGAMARQELEDTQTQLRRTHAQLEEVSAARVRAEQEADTLSSRVRQLKDALAAAESANRAQVGTLRAELQSNLERAEAAAEHSRSMHAQREASLTNQVDSLKQQLLESEARMSQSSKEHEIESLRLQSRLGALEASLEGSRLREAGLERDCSMMQAEIDRLNKAIGGLQAEVAAGKVQAQEYAERADEACAQLDGERRLRMQLQSQLEASSTRAAVREDQLGSEASRFRNEVAALTLANEKLQGDMRMCQEQLSDAAARRSSNERHIEELHGTIQALTKSKSKLQTTMLEQLGLFKTKLGQVEQENITLRSALASLDRRAQSLAAARAGAGVATVGSPGGTLGPGAGSPGGYRGPGGSPGGAGAGGGGGGTGSFGGLLSGGGYGQYNSPGSIGRGSMSDASGLYSDLG